MTKKERIKTVLFILGIVSLVVLAWFGVGFERERMVKVYSDIERSKSSQEQIDNTEIAKCRDQMWRHVTIDSKDAITGGIFKTIDKEIAEHCTEKIKGK